MFEKRFLGFLVGSLFFFVFFSVSFSNFQLINSKTYDRVCDRFEVDEDKIYYSGAFLRWKSNIDFCSQYVRSNVNREAVKMNRFCLYGPDMNSCSYVFRYSSFGVLPQLILLLKIIDYLSFLLFRYSSFGVLPQHILK